MRKEQIPDINKERQLKKKLVLNKETLRELKDTELKMVAGGGITSLFSCTSGCISRTFITC